MMEGRTTPDFSIHTVSHSDDMFYESFPQALTESKSENLEEQKDHIFDDETQGKYLLCFDNQTLVGSIDMRWGLGLLKFVATEKCFQFEHNL